MLDRAARLLLAGACLGRRHGLRRRWGADQPNADRDDDRAGKHRRPHAGSHHQADAYALHCAPGSVIRYYFEDADTLRGVRADGLFDYPTKAWSYARTGARSGEIEITWENDGRSEIDSDVFCRRPRNLRAAGLRSLLLRVYCGDVTQLHYRGDFEVRIGAGP